MDNNTSPSSASKFKREVGGSGTYIFSGIITQEEYNRNLAGQLGKQTYDIMRRSDATIRAALQACKLPIRSLDYTIEPASDDQKDQDIAAFVQRELFDRNINFEDYLREALTMFDFGFSVFEKTYEVCDFNGQQLIGIAKIASRKQRSVLYWTQTDGSQGIRQQLLGANSSIISIPIDKLVIFTNEKEGDNYEGISLLRYAYKDWDMKDKLGLVNAIALEKMAIGVPVISPPASADEASKTLARSSLRQMRANEESYIEKPKDWDLEMLDMKAQSTKDVLPTIEYHNHQIMLSVLAQFLMLGSSGSSGSRATSKDHSQLFMLAEESAVKNFVSTTQKQFIKQLCDLNFADMPNGYPKLKSSRVADDNVAVLANAMNQLATAGLLTPDADLEQFTRQTIHAPDLSEDDRQTYELKRQAAQNAIVNPPDPTVIPNPKDPNLNAGDTKPVPPKDIAAAVQNAKNARKILVNFLED